MSKPFNLEAALAGEPIETRDGRKVTELHYFKTSGESFSVIAIVDGYSHSYTTNGGYQLYRDHELDLVMSAKKHTVWHCVFKNRGGVHASDAHYGTEADLLAHMNTCWPHAEILGTYCTEWEE